MYAIDNIIYRAVFPAQLCAGRSSVSCIMKGSGEERYDDG